MTLEKSKVSPSMTDRIFGRILTILIVGGFIFVTSLTYYTRKYYENNYNMALTYILNEDYDEAIESLKKCNDYMDSREIMEDITKKAVADSILDLSEINEEKISKILDKYY